jgi:hypothetical protein
MRRTLSPEAISTLINDEVFDSASFWERDQLPAMMVVKNRTVQVLRKEGLTTQSTRMAKCGVRVGPYGPTRALCGLTNWCPFCISFRAFRQRMWLKRKVLSSSPSSLTWLHITSTVKNCRPNELKIYSQAVITGTERLLLHPELKGLIVGTLSAVEYKKVEAEPRLTMAHVHTLVALNRRQGQAFVPFARWQTLWPEVCPKGLGRDLVVREITDGKQGLDTRADYITKDSEYDDSQNRVGFITRWDARLDNPKRFVTEVTETSRKWRFFGNLKRPKTFAQRREWKAPW